MPNRRSRRSISFQTSFGCTPSDTHSTDEIIDEVGAFPHDRFAAAVHGVDHDLDGFFAELLGDLGAARAQQPRGARLRRIGMPGREDGLIKAIDRISHAPTHSARESISC